MKRFTFSLQALHNLRVMRREAAEQELARATGEVAAARARLEEIRQTRTAAIDDYIATLSAGALSEEVTLRTSYIEALKWRETDQQARIIEFERTRELKRQNLEATTRDADAIDKLREHHYARHKLESERLEQKMLDELTTIRFARNNKR